MTLRIELGRASTRAISISKDSHRSRTAKPSAALMAIMCSSRLAFRQLAIFVVRIPAEHS